MRPYIILLIFLVLIKSVLSQAKWEMILPPSPTSNQLVSLDFIDETTGWSVGEYGTILKTNDGGNTWRIIEIPQLNYLQDVYFPTAAIGYIVGEDGIILKSIDGGESWTQQVNPFTNNLNRVRFINETTGWIVGEKGLILHTNDGGHSWTQQNSHTGESLNGLALVGTQAVYAVGGDSTILVTDDYGQTWHKKTFITTDTRNRSYDFKDVFFLDELLGWIVGYKSWQGILIKTIDGGITWKEVSIDEFRYNDFHSGSGGSDTFVGLQQVLFIDRWYGFCLTDARAGETISNLPLYTRTGGRKWYSQMLGSFESCRCRGRMAYLSENRIINTGYGGEFRISTDKGVTWSFTNQSKRNLIPYFFIGNQGQLAVRREFPLDVDEWLFSKDYGKNWTHFVPQFFDSAGNIQTGIGTYNIPWGRIDNDKKLRRICCVKTAVPYEEDYLLYESTDLGRSWHFLHQVVKEISHALFLTADTLIYYRIVKKEISKNNYKHELKFVYSFDGGRSAVTENFVDAWNVIRASYPFISRHYFFNGHTGFLVGSEGNIIKTTNTGQSWKNVPSGVVEDLWDITFINRNVGFVVGDFGRILKTEDGGETWRKTSSGTQEDVYAIGFKNETEGYAGTETGLLSTNDSGETWQKVPMRYIHGKIREIEFDAEGTGYAYTHKLYSDESSHERPGAYVLLLVLKEGGVEVAHPKPVSPYSFALHPNYPNPFNSTTIFRFSLPESEAVTLTIYNIRGQRVHTLVDKSLESGEHEVTWNGVNQAGQAVASGVYVARLRRQGEVRTRKVVVLR